MGAEGGVGRLLREVSCGAKNDIRFLRGKIEPLLEDVSSPGAGLDGPDGAVLFWIGTHAEGDRRVDVAFPPRLTPAASRARRPISPSNPLQRGFQSVSE